LKLVLNLNREDYISYYNWLERINTYFSFLFLPLMFLSHRRFPFHFICIFEILYLIHNLMVFSIIDLLLFLKVLIHCRIQKYLYCYLFIYFGFHITIIFANFLCKVDIILLNFFIFIIIRNDFQNTIWFLIIFIFKICCLVWFKFIFILFLFKKA